MPSLLIATRLPDGSRITYERNGQNQVVALTRNPIQTHWLRWAVKDQTLAKDFTRDLAGLASYTSGNGVQSQWQRSPAGDLARIVHRAPSALKTITAGQAGNMLLGHSTQETIERLLGITNANAQTAQAAPSPASQNGEAAKGNLPGESNKSTLPGALGLPRDPQALIDHRYLWDDRGNLLLSQNPAQNTGNATEQSAHAYTRRGQLIASVRSTVSSQQQEAGMQSVSDKAANPAKEQHTWRYAYDSQQRRILAQESTTQTQLQASTQRAQFQQNSAKQQNTDYDASGMPITARNSNSNDTSTHAQRHYRWDAAGRLMSIGQSDATGQRTETASYQYDHRGLRNSKTLQGQQTTHYLYSADKQLLAEISQDGKIQRQYIYLADMPIAVIDSQEGKLLKKSLSKQERSAQDRRAETAQNASNSEQNAAQTLSFEESTATIIWADLKTIAHIWSQALGAQSSEQTAFIHVNHLGAPEAVTDAQAQPIWQASYAPFGGIIKASLKARAVSNEAAKGKDTSLAFILNLRLPGQYEDTESGLHYNRQRYYDPQEGSYISPDPLGTPDGPNPYAYTAFNPLKYIDPDGLILFAFDGTNNDEADPNTISNVVRFRNLYQVDPGSARPSTFYITGPGTTDPRSGISGGFVDTLGSTTGKQRIARLIQDLQDSANAETDDNKALDIDVIGFSRGAAQARDFASQITAASQGNLYRYTIKDAQGKDVQKCQKLNFRFMGIWDTVLSTHAGSYQLGIPTQFAHVAHAVALNEYRALFPSESIMQAPQSVIPVAGRVRIERGFLGAHSDIGGSFADGDLSRVALVWMVDQATAARVSMDTGRLDRTIIANPVIHDNSSNLFRQDGPAPNTFSEDRVIRYQGGTSVRQRTSAAQGMTFADTQQDNMISYSTNPRGNVAGTVDSAKYLAWLNNNGYGINMTVR